MKLVRTKHFFSYVILTAGAVIVAFPFLWMLVTSLKTPQEAAAGIYKVLPDDPQWQNYSQAWKNTSQPDASFGTYFRNSLIVATAVTLAVLFTSILAGYAFATMEFRGKNLIFVLFLATMMIPFEVALIPNFRIIRALGLYNTLPALIVPWMANVFSIFILRQFFRGIPRDYFEAAQIDGCGHWRYLWQIAVPMALPALATITIFTFLGSWNALLWPLLVVDSPNMYVVQHGLALLKGEEATNFNILMAASAIVIMPIVVLYLILQKRFIEGVSGTGIKG